MPIDSDIVTVVDGQASARGTAGKPPPVPMSSSECGASSSTSRGASESRTCVVRTCSGFASDVRFMTSLASASSARNDASPAQNVSLHIVVLCLTGSASGEVIHRLAYDRKQLCHAALFISIHQTPPVTVPRGTLRQSEPLRQNALDDADRHEEDDDTSSDDAQRNGREWHGSSSSARTRRSGIQCRRQFPEEGWRQTERARRRAHTSPGRLCCGWRDASGSVGTMPIVEATARAGFSSK